MGDEAGAGLVDLLERQLDADVAAAFAVVHRRNRPRQPGPLVVVIGVVVAS
jgi:hypothetical protein